MFNIFGIFGNKKQPNYTINQPSPPKKPLSAFFLFKQQNYDQVKLENPNAKLTELICIISDQWKNVSEEEKQKYEKLSSDAKLQFQKDILDYEAKFGYPGNVKIIEKPECFQSDEENFINQEIKQNDFQIQIKSDITSQQSQKTQENDNKPPPPKRPLSAFFLFKKHNYDQVKLENPNAKITELTTLIANQWKNVSEEEKQKYEKLQSEAKLEYEKQMLDYETKYGHPEKVKKTKKPEHCYSDEENFINQEIMQNDFQIQIKSDITSQQSQKTQETKNKPPPPKRPLSAFFLFKKHNYDQVKLENPNAKITELTSIIANQWQNVSEEEKYKYIKLQSEAKLQYEKDMLDYETKYGHPEKIIKNSNQ